MNKERELGRNTINKMRKAKGGWKKPNNRDNDELIGA